MAQKGDVMLESTMQFAPAFASAAQQKLAARPSDQPVEAASASGAPEHVRIAQ